VILLPERYSSVSDGKPIGSAAESLSPFSSESLSPPLPPPLLPPLPPRPFRTSDRLSALEGAVEMDELAELLLEMLLCSPLFPLSPLSNSFDKCVKKVCGITSVEMRLFSTRDVRQKSLTVEWSRLTDLHGILGV
jgi:hypothetical protein